MTKYLDIRSPTKLGISSNARASIAKFSKKSEAKKFARSRGWNNGDALLATTRLAAFWIVGQCVGAEDFRVLCSDGSTLDMRYTGFV